MSQTLQRALLGILIGAIFGGLFAFALMKEVPILERWELNIVDWRYGMFAAPEETAPEIVIVEITEITLDELSANGQIMGADRGHISALVETLTALGARAIAIDATLKSRSIGNSLVDDLRGIIDANPRAGDFLPQDEELAMALSAAADVVLAIDAPDCAPRDGVSWDRCRRAHGQFEILDPYFEARLFPIDGESPVTFESPREGDKPYVEFPYALVLPFVRSVGFVNLRQTFRFDSTMRTFAPFVNVDRWTIADFGAATFATAVAESEPVEWVPGPLPDPRAFGPLPSASIRDRSVEIAGRHVPVDEHGEAWIRWRGNWDDPPLFERRFEAWNLIKNHEAIVFGELEKVRELDTSAFKDKVVLIGYTAQGEGADFRSTPFGSQAGVFRHASVVDTFLTEDWLRSPSASIQAFLTVVLGMLASALVLGIPIFRWQEVEGPIGPFLMALWKFAPGALLITSYVAAGAFAFSKGLVISILHPTLAMGLATTLATALAYVFTRREREEARRKGEQALALAKRTLPGAVVDEIMAKEGRVNLGGDKFTLTVYFSDIAGFTTISEKMQPEELVSVLNEYLTRVTERLVGHGAIIDKYIGDAVMAFWGAPLKLSDAPERSCLAALEAIEVIDTYSKELVARGLTPLKTRIGINTGPAIAGGVGHRDHKYNYTAMGDTVNLASRLEGANKAYGTTCMLGPETYESAKHAIVARELDLVKVKGKKIPVRVYELMGRKSDPLPEKRRIKERYEAALALYRSAKFSEARGIFLELAEKHADPPARAMVENCDERIAQPPPPDWDGSNELHEK